MTHHAAHCREMIGRHARVSILMLAAILCLLPAATSAHEGDGVDAGYGHIVATTSQSGDTTLELRITETDDCAGFHATEIIAERGTTTVYGDLDQIEPCLFGGSVSLPEQGNWTVSAWVAYNGTPADIQLPVGVSGEAERFERADWMHVEESISSDASDAWYRSTVVLAFAAIGLLLGVTFEVARRRWMAGARR